MTTHSSDVGATLATLQERWGTAAPRRGGEAYGGIVGSLATAPLPVEKPQADALPSEPFGESASPPARPLPGAPGAPAVPVVTTGFPQLDALLGPGGIPRTASLALRGDASSGRTTVALRLVAEAQAVGSVVAWLDLDRSLDPVEAVARGVRLEWLVVLAPADLDEGFAMVGSLLQARAVDVLLIDLPARLDRPARLVERLGRAAALARRAGVLLVVLEPPGRGRPDGRGDLLGATVGLRLGLVRRAWIRLGRDVVGQWTEVAIERNRFGPPGGRTELRILYADGGPRDACLRAAGLLTDGPPGRGAAGEPPGRSAGAPPLLLRPPVPIGPPVTSLSIARSDAPSPPLLATPPAPARPGASRVREDGSRPSARFESQAEPRLRLVPGRPGGSGRPTVDGRDGAGCGSRRALAGRPPRDAARLGAPARPGGDVPRPDA